MNSSLSSWSLWIEFDNDPQEKHQKKPQPHMPLQQSILVLVFVVAAHFNTQHMWIALYKTVVSDSTLNCIWRQHCQQSRKSGPHQRQHGPSLTLSILLPAGFLLIEPGMRVAKAQSLIYPCWWQFRVAKKCGTHWGTKFQKSAARYFTVQKKANMEQHRVMGTTWSNLSLWFDT